MSETADEASTDISGEMWRVGRDEFLKYAERFRQATTYEEAATIADIAPAEIWRAMRMEEFKLALGTLDPTPTSETVRQER